MQTTVSNWSTELGKRNGVMFPNLLSTDPDRSDRPTARSFGRSQRDMPERHSPDTMCQGPNRRIEGSVVDGIGVMELSIGVPWQEYAFNLEMFECYTSVSLG